MLPATVQIIDSRTRRSSEELIRTRGHCDQFRATAPGRAWSYGSFPAYGGEHADPHPVPACTVIVLARRETSKDGHSHLALDQCRDLPRQDSLGKGDGAWRWTREVVARLEDASRHPEVMKVSVGR